MNETRLNAVPLNRVGLNTIGEIRSSAGGGGGGGDVPDVPSYENGVYIQHIDGKLYTADEWTAKGFSKDEANGVAVITDKAKFVIATDEITYRKWTSQFLLIEGIAATEDFEQAKLDFAGKENTQLMLAYDKSEAGFSCANFIFPNGNKGYLPSCGEMYEAYLNMNKITQAMNLVDAVEFGGSYWTSTQVSADYAWSLSVTNGSGAIYAKNHFKGKYSRPFTTL